MSTKKLIIHEATEKELAQKPGVRSQDLTCEHLQSCVTFFALSGILIKVKSKTRQFATASEIFSHFIFSLAADALVK